jgi:hypothetical protein
MKTFARGLALFTLAVPLLVSAVIRAQELTHTDKDKALQLLETSRKGVLEASKDLTPAQWNFKPAPDRWSVAECMEHIAAAEDYIRGMIIEKVMIAPAVPGRDVVATDAHQPLRFAPRFDRPLCGEPCQDRRIPQVHSRTP